MRLFVTGGSGFLGKPLIRRLAAEGHQVLALARSAQARQAVESCGAVAIDGSLDDIPAWEGRLSGCDAVIHAAAPVEFWGPWSRFEAGIVRPTANLARAALRQGVARLVHVSSESVLQDKGSLIGANESTPYPAEPNSYYGRAKKLAEQDLLALGGPMEVVVIRPTFIWGPGCPNFVALRQKVTSGQFLWIDGGRPDFEAVHVDNVVEAIRLALVNASARGVYIVTDDEPAQARGFLGALFKALGMDEPTASLPGGLARPAAALVESVWRALRIKMPPPLTRFDLAFIAQPRRYDIGRIKRDLGYRPIKTRSQGLAELAAQS